MEWWGDRREVGGLQRGNVVELDRMQRRRGESGLEFDVWDTAESQLTCVALAQSVQREREDGRR